MSYESVLCWVDKRDYAHIRIKLSEPAPVGVLAAPDRLFKIRPSYMEGGGNSGNGYTQLHGLTDGAKLFDTYYVAPDGYTFNADRDVVEIVTPKYDIRNTVTMFNSNNQVIDEATFTLYEATYGNRDKGEQFYEQSCDLVTHNDGLVKIIVHNPLVEKALDYNVRLAILVNTGERNEDGEVVLREIGVGVGIAEFTLSKKFISSYCYLVKRIFVFEPLDSAITYYARFTINDEIYIKKLSWDSAKGIFLSDYPARMAEFTIATGRY